MKNEGNFIPITCGMALAIASIGVLIYFIHRVSVAIQAENVIARVGYELRVAIDKHFPEEPIPGVQQQEHPAHHNHAITAIKSGYLQTLDRGDLIELALTNEATYTIKKRPGDYVFSRDTMAQVWIRQNKHFPLAFSRKRDVVSRWEIRGQSRRTCATASGGSRRSRRVRALPELMIPIRRCVALTGPRKP